MGCKYTYKGKEFSTRLELEKEVVSDYYKGDIKIDQNFSVRENLHAIEGTEKDRTIKKIVLEAQAEVNFGTKDIISYINVDGVEYVKFDYDAMDDIQSGMVTLKNSETGGTVSVSMKDVANQYKETNEYPPYENIESHLQKYFLDQIMKDTTEKMMEFQRKQKEGKQSNNTLMEKLTAFANGLGVSVTTLDLYKDAFLKRNGQDLSVEALADIMKKIIALSNTNNTGQMAEEVAHFAIAFFHDEAIMERMIEQVPNTNMYKQEAQKQRDKYSSEQGLSGEALEQMVRKEILGKILSQKILDNFNEDVATNSSEVGIFAQLKRLWERFKSLFTQTDANKKFFAEFGKVLDQISTDIKLNNVTNYKQRNLNEVYYQAEPEIRAEIDNLLGKIKDLEDKYEKIATDDRMTVVKKKAELEYIREGLIRGSYYTHMYEYMNILKNDLQEAVAMIGSAEQAVQGTDKDFTEVIGRVDLQNLLGFTSGLNTMMDSLSDLINNSDDDLLSNTQKQKILNRIKDVKVNYTSIEGKLKKITDYNYKKSWNNLLDDYGIFGNLRDKMTKNLKDGFTDVSRAMRWFFSPFALGNEIVQFITALYQQAEVNSHDRVMEATTKMRNLQDRYNLPASQIQKLYRGHHVASPFLMSEFENDYNKVIEEVKTRWDKKIQEEILTNDALDDNEKQEKEVEYLNERDKELTELKFEWEIPPFNRNYFDRIKEFSPATLSILQERSSIRAKILKKYRNPSTGKIEGKLITENDLVKLQTAQSRMKLHMSLFYEDGTPKTGVSKKIANELTRYLDSDFSRTELLTDDFEIARNRIIADYGTGSPQYRNWLKTYAVEVYDESEFGEPSFVDEEETLIDPEMESIIRNSLGLGDDATYQELYEGLLQKRRQLVAPYREINRFNEIDGTLIEQNEELVKALNAVNYQLGQFEVKGGDTMLDYRGNDSWERSIDALQGNPSELRQHLRKHGAVNSEDVYRAANGQIYQVPKTYYYKTFRIVADREEGTIIKPKIKPNYLWIAENESNSEINEDFNEAFRGKSKMPNYINKPQYIDEEYFQLFGIDKSEVIGVGANGFGTATRNIELWEVYQSFLETKEEADKIYQIGGQYFLLPQIEADLRETTRLGAQGSLKAWFKKNFTLENSDPEFGNINVTESEEDNNKFGFSSEAIEGLQTIPKRYTNKLKSSKVLTRNFSRSYMQYAESAYEFDEKTKILPEIVILRDKLANAPIKPWLGKRHKASENSNVLAMLDDWIDTNIYGHTHNSGHIWRTKLFSKTVGLSTTKMMKFLYRWISKTNLAFNIFVPVVGFINATVTKRILAHVGSLTTSESLNWAVAETTREFASYVNDVGSINPQNKIKKIFEFMNFNVDRGQVYDGIFESRGFRLANAPLGELGYMHYNIAGTITGAQSLFSVMDNNRLWTDANGNVKFTNKRAFETELKASDPTLSSKDINDRWSSLKINSYYNYLINEKNKPIRLDLERLQRDGFLEEPTTPEIAEKNSRKITSLQAKIRRTGIEMHSQVEGLISPEDRAAIQKNPMLMFFSMHRGWLQSAIQSRLKARHVNIYTATEEEGSYITMGRIASDSLRSGQFAPLLGALSYVLTLGAYQDGIKNLEEFEKGNLKRLKGDIMAFTLTFAFYILANMAADDDEDDYFKQYMGYVASRVFSEQAATQMPTALGEFYTIAQSPVAGIGFIEDLLNVPQIILEMTGNEVVKTGAYEGRPKWEKHLIKKTPLKNLYEPIKSNARKSNLFFRQRTIGTWQNELLKSWEISAGIREKES